MSFYPSTITSYLYFSPSGADNKMLIPTNMESAFEITKYTGTEDGSNSVELIENSYMKIDTISDNITFASPILLSNIQGQTGALNIGTQNTTDVRIGQPLNNLELNNNIISMKGGNTSTSPELRLFDRSNTNYIGLKTTNAQNTNYTLTLPSAPASTNGQVLSSSTSGLLSWQTTLNNGVNTNDVNLSSLNSLTIGTNNATGTITNTFSNNLLNGTTNTYISTSNTGTSNTIIGNPNSSNNLSLNNNIINLQGGNTLSSPELRFYERTNTNYVALKAPNVNSNFSLTLPNSQGTNGQILSTSGTGSLIWVDPSFTGIPTTFDYVGVWNYLTNESRKATITIDSNLLVSWTGTTNNANEVVNYTRQGVLQPNGELFVDGIPDLYYPDTFFWNGTNMTITNGPDGTKTLIPSLVLGSFSPNSTLTSLQTNANFITSSSGSFGGILIKGDETINGNLTLLGKINGTSIKSGTTYTHIGNNASSSTADYNTSLGPDSLLSLTSGVSNTAVGTSSSYYTTTGINNTSLGVNSLRDNISGESNTSIGYESGLNLTSGNNNLFLGKSADTTLATVSNSIALGNGARTTKNNQMVIGNTSLSEIMTSASGSFGGLIIKGNENIGGSLSVFGTVSVGSSLSTVNLTASSNITSASLNTTSLDTSSINSNSIINLGNITSGSGAFNSLLSTNINSTNLTNSGSGSFGGIFVSGNVNSANITTLTNNVSSLNTTNNNIKIGSNYTHIGNNATSNTTAYNTSIGSANMLSITTGTSNSSFGQGSLYNLTTANQNSAFGHDALINSNGNDNVGFGRSAGAIISSGSSNSFFGTSSDSTDATVINSTAIGNSAIITKSNQMVLGNNNLTEIITSASGSFSGLIVKNNQNIGGALTVVGQSQSSNYYTDNSNNIGLNHRFSSLTSGTQNIGIGASMQGVSSGHGNIGAGYTAGNKITSGNDNIAIGFQSLIENVSGDFNVSVGRGSLMNTTSSNNTALGTNALRLNTTGAFNTSLGRSSLENNTIGTNNVSLGYNTLESNLSGSYNVSLGSQSGKFSESDYNTFLGYNANSGNSSHTNSIALGANSVTTASNTCQIGDGSLTTINTSANIVSNGTNLNSAISNLQTYTTSSSGSFGGLVVKGNQNIGGVLNVTGDITSNGNNLNNLISTNTSNITNLQTYTTSSSGSFGGLIVKGNQNIQGNLTVDGTITGSVNISNLKTSSTYTHVGDNATNNTSNYNTSVGTATMGNLSSGTSNSSFGQGSLNIISTASSNSAFGHDSLLTSNGDNNSAFGRNSGNSITSGTNSTFIGTNANTSLGSVVNSTAIGYGATVTENNQMILGNSSLQNINTTATIYSNNLSTNINDNVSLGFKYTSSATGSQNIGIGPSALTGITTGYGNIGMGYTSGNKITTGIHNIAIGFQSLIENVSGNYNLAIGLESLQNTISSSNTSIGASSMKFNINGVANTALGQAASHKNTSGSNNCSIGYNSSIENLIGSCNVAIGSEAGRYNESNHNTYIGYDARGDNSGYTNSIAIGSQAHVTSSNACQIGSTSLQNINTTANINCGNTVNVYNASGNAQVNVKGNTYSQIQFQHADGSQWANYYNSNGRLQWSKDGYTPLYLDPTQLQIGADLLVNGNVQLNTSSGSTSMGNLTSGSITTSSSGSFGGMIVKGNLNVGSLTVPSKATDYVGVWNYVSGDKSAVVTIDNNLVVNWNGESNNGNVVNTNRQGVLQTNGDLLVGGINGVFYDDTLKWNGTSMTLYNQPDGTIPITVNRTSDYIGVWDYVSGSKKATVTIDKNLLVTWNGISNYNVDVNASRQGVIQSNGELYTPLVNGLYFDDTFKWNGKTMSLYNQEDGSITITPSVFQGAFTADSTLSSLITEASFTSSASGSFSGLVVGGNITSGSLTTGNLIATGTLTYSGIKLGGTYTHIGSDATSNTSNYNTSVGVSAMLNISSGTSNSAFGQGALNQVTTGNNNSSFGHDALLYNNGNYNVGFGSGAGINNTSGINNTFIGSSSNTTNNAVNNSSAIGFEASVTKSNQMVLGNNSLEEIKTSAYIVSKHLKAFFNCNPGEITVDIGTTGEKFIQISLIKNLGTNFFTIDQNVFIYITKPGFYKINRELIIKQTQHPREISFRQLATDSSNLDTISGYNYIHKTFNTDQITTTLVTTDFMQLNTNHYLSFIADYNESISTTFNGISILKGTIELEWLSD